MKDIQFLIQNDMQLDKMLDIFNRTDLIPEREIILFI